MVLAGEDGLDIPDFHIKSEGEILKEHNILGLGEGELDLLVKVCNKHRVLKVIDRHEWSFCSIVLNGLIALGFQQLGMPLEGDICGRA